MPKTPATVEPVEPTDHLHTATAQLASAGQRDPEHTDRCVFRRDDTPPLLAAMAHAMIAAAQATSRMADALDAIAARQGPLDTPTVPAEPLQAPAVTRYVPAARQLAVEPRGIQTNV